MDQGICKINVLELNSGFVYAGGARNLYSFCKYLNKEVFNVFAASYGNGGPGEAILRTLGIEFVLAKGNAKLILDFVKEKKINIVHIHRSGVYVPIEHEIVKGIKEICKDIAIVEKNVFGNYDERIAKHINCSMFQSMMHVNERYLQKSGLPFDFKKMKVLYNMVDGSSFEKYRLTEEEIKNYKKELGISENDFVIGKIARPHIAKWSDLLLYMMPYLVSAVPNLKFIIIGTPKSRIKIIEKGPYRKHFILLDETSDEKIVHKFYQTIDVLAHSSKIGECNGNTINEAMYWEKSVVVNSTPTRDNGQLEQIDHLKDGIIANFPQTFAKALEYLYTNVNKRKEMGKVAKARILAKNAPETIIGQLEKVFIENLELQSENFGIKEGYCPTEEDIINYKKEYKNRLNWEFGELAFKDKIKNLFIKPRQFYYKINDYLEDNVWKK